MFLRYKRIRRFTWCVVHPVSLPSSGVAAAVPPPGMQAARTKTIGKPKNIFQKAMKGNSDSVAAHSLLH